jgi:hypothetical protein
MAPAPSTKAGSRLARTLMFAPGNSCRITLSIPGF